MSQSKVRPGMSSAVTGPEARIRVAGSLLGPILRRERFVGQARELEPGDVRISQPGATGPEQKQGRGECGKQLRLHVHGRTDNPRGVGGFHFGAVKSTFALNSGVR